jgi:regulator of protease activity HflC (stomatin/prohibitin superfamily)
MLSITIKLYVIELIFKVLVRYNKIMQATLPIEVYEAFEKGLGRIDAKTVVKSIETTISDNIEYKWVTTKDDLLSEMKKEFVTKADLNLLREEQKSDMQQLRAEQKADVQQLRAEQKSEAQQIKAEQKSEAQQIRAEIQNVRAEQKSEAQQIRAEIQNVRAEQKSDVQQLWAEIQLLRSEIQLVKTELEGKITNLSSQSRLYFVILLSVIIITNPKALELISKIFTIIK